jgi:hypothetical protein
MYILFYLQVQLLYKLDTVHFKQKNWALENMESFFFRTRTQVKASTPSASRPSPLYSCGKKKPPISNKGQFFCLKCTVSYAYYCQYSIFIICSYLPVGAHEFTSGGWWIQSWNLNVVFCFQVFCVEFCRLLFFFSYSFGHYIIGLSPIRGFWLPVWYLQTFLMHELR